MKSIFHKRDSRKVRLREEARSAFVPSLEMLLMFVKGVYMCTDPYQDMKRTTEGIVPLSVCKRMQVTAKTNTNRFNKCLYLMNWGIFEGKNTCIKGTLD